MAAMSVRMRLIVLSLIPVVGFAAVGFSYISSEHTVDAAFGSVRQSARLAESSRAFKDALITMQMRAKEYAAQPQPVLISRFGEAEEAAVESLKTLQGLVEDSEKQNLVGLEGRVANLKATFAALTAEQDELDRGLREQPGIAAVLAELQIREMHGKLADEALHLLGPLVFLVDGNAQ